MQLIIHCDLATGDVRFLHDDTLAQIVPGEMRTTRASNIVFNHDMQKWEVHLSSGEVVYSSASNRECYGWERRHFNRPPGK